MNKRLSIDQCEICKQIDDSEFADYIWDQNAHFPEAAERLENIQILGFYYPILQRCPVCGRYYIYNYSCGYMEHDKSLERLRDDICDWIDSQPKGPISSAEIEKRQRQRRK